MEGARSPVGESSGCCVGQPPRSSAIPARACLAGRSGTTTPSPAPESDFASNNAGPFGPRRIVADDKGRCRRNGTGPYTADRAIAKIKIWSNLADLMGQQCAGARAAYSGVADRARYAAQASNCATRFATLAWRDLVHVTAAWPAVLTARWIERWERGLRTRLTASLAARQRRLCAQARVKHRAGDRGPVCGGGIRNGKVYAGVPRLGVRRPVRHRMTRAEYRAAIPGCTWSARRCANRAHHLA